MTKLLSVAYLFAAVLLCRADPADPAAPDLRLASQISAKAQRAATHIARKVSKQPVVRRSRIAGRRLGEGFPDVKFSEMCNSECWKGISERMTTFYRMFEEKKCGEVFNRRLSESGGESESESSEQDGCMFNQCGEMAMVCNMLSHDPRQDIPAEQLNFTNPHFNRTALILNMTASMFLDNPCMKSTMEFMCFGICSESCARDSENERKLFCSPDGDDEGESHDGGMQDHEEENDDQHDKDDDDQEAPPSADDMATMFNMMCLKDPVDNSYCYDKIREDTEKGAWKEDGPADAFPDPCNINCSTPTAQAISGLGCCFASLLDASHKMDMMTITELRLAKAGASKCAPQTAWTLCSGEESVLVDTKLTVVDVNLPLACPDLAEKEQEFTKALTEQTGNQVTFEVLTCQETSCDGRRLEEGASVKFLMKAMGSDRDAKALDAQKMVNDEQEMSKVFARLSSSGDCVEISRKTFDAVKAKGWLPATCKNE